MLMGYTMTDRELLEAAAKASGREDWNHSPNIKADEGDPRPWWNPLTDDGDALRLFTRMPFCELYVSEIGVSVYLPREAVGEGPNLKCDEYASEHDSDLGKATRRAIVRAAAARARELT
jgi:hypothetical protein